MLLKYYNDYEQRNPNLLRVSGAPNENILKWAARNKYITFIKYGRRTYYTKDLEKIALIWYNKIYKEVN